MESALCKRIGAASKCFNRDEVAIRVLAVEVIVRKPR